MLTFIRFFGSTNEVKVGVGVLGLICFVSFRLPLWKWGNYVSYVHCCMLLHI